MHKLLERIYNYFVKILEDEEKKIEAMRELYGEPEELGEKINKMLHLPPLDAKNPYRFL